MSINPVYPVECDIPLSIKPIYKKNWKTTEGRDYFRPALTECKNAYYKVEIMGVLDEENPRRAALIDGTNIPMNNVLTMLDDTNAVVRLVGNNGIIVGTDGETVGEGIMAFQTGDYETLGRLFGYPESAIEFYGKHLVENPEQVPIYEMACATDSAVPVDDDPEYVHVDVPDGMVNPIWHYMGWKFISHIPASFDCPESREIALRNAGYLRELGLGSEAERLFTFLTEPVTWDGYHGLSNIRNGYAIGSTNTPAYWSKKTVEFRGPHSLKKEPPKNED